MIKQDVSWDEAERRAIDALDSREQLRELRERLDNERERDDWNNDENLEIVDTEVDIGEVAESSSLLGSVLQLNRRIQLGESRERAAELKLNHARLQVGALRNKCEEMSCEVEEMRFQLIEAEEVRVLLETRVQELASFEREAPCSVDELRGELLRVAHQQITSLSAENRQLKESASRSDWRLADEVLLRDDELQSLRERVTLLTDQLAQRTVLYSAHERRWRDEARGRAQLEAELQSDGVQMRSRLQLLERQYADSDRARLEALLLGRQQAETIARLEALLQAEQERIATLDDELGSVSAQNLALQSVVERLRGADLEELERGMVAEVEAVRSQGRRQDEETRRQLADARELLLSESARREALIDELNEVRRERDEKHALLESLRDAGLLARRDQLEDSGLVGEGQIEEPGGGVALLRELQTRSSPCADVAALVDSFAAALRQAGVDEEQTRRAVASAFGFVELEESSARSVQLDEGFLVGGDAAQAAELQAALTRAQRRETLLSAALKEQGEKMALVLRRAADFETTIVDRVHAEHSKAASEELELLRNQLLLIGRERLQQEGHFQRQQEELQLELRLQEEESLRQREMRVWLERRIEQLEGEVRAVQSSLTSAARDLARFSGGTYAGEDKDCAELCRLVASVAAQLTGSAARASEESARARAENMRSLAREVSGIKAEALQLREMALEAPRELQAHIASALRSLTTKAGAGTASVSQPLTSSSAQTEREAARDVNTEIAAARQELETHFARMAQEQAAQYRREHRQKVKTKLTAIRVQFEQERAEILDMVKAECAAILEEARRLLALKEKSGNSTAGDQLNASFVGADGELTLYPEMISPEQTLELVQSVLRRSQSLSEDEWREIYVNNRVQQ